mgnify:CR=1 FL=1
MRTIWKKESALAAWRLPEGFAPFADLLPDPDNRIAQALAKTRISPLWAKEWRCRHGWAVGPRALPFSDWWLFPDHRGWIYLEETREKLILMPGDWVLIPEGVAHAGGVSGAGCMRHFAGHFHANAFGSINLLKLIGFPIRVPGSARAPFLAAAQRMVREYALQAPGWREAMANDLFALLLHVIREHGSLFHADRFAAACDVMSEMVPLLEEVEKGLGDPGFSPGELARRAGLNEQRVRRLFKLATGVNPVLFIQRRRIGRAVEQLRFTRAGIKAVAAQCGFSELSFFYRVFKHWTGFTPAQFRARLGIEKEG